MFKTNELNAKELRFLCRQIGLIFKSGNEIITSFEEIMKKSQPKIKRATYIIIENLKNGKNLTESFIMTNSFSAFFIAMLKTGELSGNVDKIMDNLTDYYSKEYKIKTKLKNISIYPVILIFMSYISFSFMMVKVIPNFARLFENSNVKLPIISKIIINFSMVLKQHFFLVNFSMVFIIAVTIYYIKTNKNIKMKLDRLKFQIPKIKDFFLIAYTVKFSRSLEIMISSGVSIIEAVKITMKLNNNMYIVKKLNYTLESIKKGNKISDSLEMIDLFPILFISVLRSGEKSGEFDASLKTVTEFYEQELELEIDKILRLIEPIVIAVIGIIISVIIIGILIPILDSVSTISN